MVSPHGLKPCAAPQSPRVPPTCVRPLLRGHLRGLRCSALLPVPPAGQRLVMATDAHVITPLFFPGGDIGSLAVHGTVNDVAMLGATPLYQSASFSAVGHSSATK